MNKKELAAQVANKNAISLNEATDVIEAVINTIGESLKEGEDVRITGFGTFQVKKRAPREGRNPRTGEKLQIPESNVPSFKASKTLKDLINP